MVKKVAFCIATNKWQLPEWWRSLVEAIIEAERDPDIEFCGLYTNGTASPDYTKNNLVVAAAPMNANRETLTDNHRNDITKQVEDSEADYLYWWDDDTTHPSGTLKKLLALEVPFAAGLYYLKTAPYVPVAYFKNPNGTYRSMLQFRLGEIVTVDFCGMGCALVHRSVYDKIREAYSLYKTDRGSYVLVENENDVSVKDHQSLSMRLTDSDDAIGTNGAVVGGQYHIQRVNPVTQEEARSMKLHFPWYGMEVTRTEDVWFCNLAEHVGVKPVIDTSINCGHWGNSPTEREHFRMYEFWSQEGGNDGKEKKEVQGIEEEKTF